MRVVLVNPSMFGRELEMRWDKGAKYPPLGLAYIAAVLEGGGHKVSIIDGEVSQLTDEDFIKEIKRLDPELVGITTHSPKHNQMVKTIDLLKGKEIKLALGGPHSTIVPEDIMKENPAVDFIVYGEGEYTFLELVNALEREGSLNDIRGLIYREDGRIKTNPPRPLIENLDELPFPARHLLPDLKLYKSAFRYKRLPMTTMITSRGCPYNCLFCLRFFGRKYRGHSARRVVDEMTMLQEKYGIREIHIWDDVFMLDAKRTDEVCELIKKEKLDMSWSCNGRINILYSNKGLMDKLKQAGCWYMTFGIESGNQKVLDFIRKSIRLEQVKEVIGYANKAGISCRGYFMLGHPTDTEETIRDTIDFAKSLPLDGVQFSVTVPYPGTDLYDIADRYGTFDKGAYQRMSGHTSDPIFVPNGLTKEKLMKLQKQAYKEFFFRPSFILKHLVRIRSWESVKKYSERGSTFFRACFLQKKARS